MLCAKMMLRYSLFHVPTFRKMTEGKRIFLNIVRTDAIAFL